MYSASTKMPNLRLTDGEAADITAYLSMLTKEDFLEKKVSPLEESIVDNIVLDFLKKMNSDKDARIKRAKMNLGEKLDFNGKKLVVFFYPKASTPGCTVEACNLRDNYQEFIAKGYAILGVSADSEKRQKNFSDKNTLPYDLLADENKNVINAFGVWGPKKFMGREYDGIHRTTFIIDENGLITNVITKVKTKEHTSQILG